MSAEKTNTSGMRWIHVDLKGIIPSLSGMLEYLRFWKKCGFNGIVLEYEDRIAFKTWPGAWRRGYTASEHKKIIDECRKLDLELVPLIQTLGHLEWLLKHERYAFLREGDFLNVICPSQEKTIPLLKKWIDEVIQRHPKIRYLHLGADEAWGIGSCPECRKQNHEELVFSHLCEITGHAVKRGVIPIIWHDCILNASPKMWKRLPQEMIVCNWDYFGKAPFESTGKLLKTPFGILGCSALSCTCADRNFLLMGRLPERLENVSGWNEYASGKGIGVLHTAWGRSNSLAPCYGCWSGLVALSIAAGSPEKWKRHEWHGKMNKVFESVMNSRLNKSSLAQDVLSFHAADKIEKNALVWLNLTLRYQMLNETFFALARQQKSSDEAAKYMGGDPFAARKRLKWFLSLQEGFDRWEKEARSFWRKNRFSDEKEFFDTHVGIAKKELAEMMQSFPEIMCPPEQ